MTRALVGAAFLSLCLGGCGRRHPSGEDEGEAKLVLKLNPLGFVHQNVYPGEVLTLKVAALKSAGKEIQDHHDLVAADGEVISWALSVNAPGDASLASDATLTDAGGISSVAVGVGTEQDLTYQVRAELSGATPVTFSIYVRREQRDLELLSASPLDSVVNRTERLRVRLYRPVAGSATGTPVPKVELKAELLGGARHGARLDSEDGKLATVTTDYSGIATVRFETGAAPDVLYRVEFCGKASCPGIPTRYVEVSVGNRDNGAECQYYTDCLQGYFCVDGECISGASYCDDASDCPPGYTCHSVDRTCVVGDPDVPCVTEDDCEDGEICGAAGNCIPFDGCLNDNECGDGFTCDETTGACIPDLVVPALDVRGEWLTRHQIDISDVMPGFFRNGLGPVVDFLDMIFRSQLEIDIPLVGDILEGMIDALIAEYVPPWVHMVVTVLGDFIHLFETMESEGEMYLSQEPETPILGPNVSGEEEWLSAHFFVASLCPGGIQQFQQDRSCGQMDVVLDPVIDIDYSNNDPTVGVRVFPFTGRVEGDSLHLYNRRVQLALKQLVNVLLDLVVSVASNGYWYDFEEFLVDIVPCLDLQYAIDDLACDITDGRVCQIPGVEALCEAAALAATSALTDALGELAFKLQLDFDAHAHIYDSPVDGYADLMGNPANPAGTYGAGLREALLNGEMEAGVMDGNIGSGSWWYGSR